MPIVLTAWQKILCILGLVVLIHWYIFTEWKYRSLARAVRSLRNMARVARDPWAEERAMMHELRERVAHLEESASKPNEEEDVP